jgi:hypothetical protein
MRTDRGARVQTVNDLLVGRVGVADRGNDAAAGEKSDRVQRLGQFRRDRHHPDHTRVRRVQQCLEFRGGRRPEIGRVLSAAARL